VQPDSRLSVTIQGEGPNTIVFGNGLSTTQQVWSQVLSYVPADWRVVRFDYVGTTPATSAHWDAARYQSYAGHAADLVGLLARLEAPRLLFVGHSMSGMIGALAEVSAPGSMSELFMIGASPSYVNREDYHGGFSADDVDGLLRSVDADLAAWMAGFGPMALGRDATSHQLADFRDTLLALRPDIGRTLLRSIFTSDHRDVGAQHPLPRFCRAERRRRGRASCRGRVAGSAHPLCAARGAAGEWPSAARHAPHAARPAAAKRLRSGGGVRAADAPPVVTLAPDRGFRVSAPMPFAHDVRPPRPAPPRADRR
jgi:pimeloyl-ACP methyl ester carboxylesterase